MITSIDKEGTKLGFDNELINFISSKKYKMPIMYSGGYGNIDHIKQVKKFLDRSDAICVSSALHFKTDSITNIKKYND